MKKQQLQFKKQFIEVQQSGLLYFGRTFTDWEDLFLGEEVVFCSAYKSRHITAPQANHCYKTFAKYTFYYILKTPFLKYNFENTNHKYTLELKSRLCYKSMYNISILYSTFNSLQ